MFNHLEREINLRKFAQVKRNLKNSIDLCVDAGNHPVDDNYYELVLNATTTSNQMSINPLIDGGSINETIYLI